MNIMKIFVIPAILTVAGCAEMLPNTISPNIEHMSHLTQHQPFTNYPSNYGINMVGVEADWEVHKNVHFTLAESLSLSKRFENQYYIGYGEIIGPREQFTGRISYSFHVRD